MKKSIVVLLLVALCLCLVACSETKKEITNLAEYEGCVLELGEAETFVNDEGKTMLRVSAAYTNNNKDPLYALCSFAVRAFQNDVEINDCSDINGEEEALIREIKNGQSLQVYFVFELTDESGVEVLIGTPTADMETIGRAFYTSPEPTSSPANGTEDIAEETAIESADTDTFSSWEEYLTDTLSTFSIQQILDNGKTVSVVLENAGNTTEDKTLFLIATSNIGMTLHFNADSGLPYREHIGIYWGENDVESLTIYNSDSAAQPFYKLLITDDSDMENLFELLN